MNNSFYDRMSRQQGWSLQRLTNKALFIVARQPIAQMLSLFGVCIGFNKQIIVAPELEEAFDSRN
ncbi:hypothetical protein TI05_06370 [Achromatium sp. WMS3]|nr:hypothetical protein TI05_06370 [Achromatium sp. WMS3]